MHNEDSCSRHLSNNQWGSLLSFLFEFLLAMQSSPQRHRQEVVRLYMIDKWTGRLKTRAENVRIHSLIYFWLWKYTRRRMNTETLRMLRFLAFATAFLLLLFFVLNTFPFLLEIKQHQVCFVTIWDMTTSPLFSKCSIYIQVHASSNSFKVRLCHLKKIRVVHS